jgi:hypothetical protein
MSDQPLTPLATKVIVAAYSNYAVENRAIAYGLHYDNPIFVIVRDYLDATVAVNNFPAGTPWVMAGTVDQAVLLALKYHFGNPSTWSNALQMQNNELAIRPEVLRGQPQKRAPV